MHYNQRAGPELALVRKSTGVVLPPPPPPPQSLGELLSLLAPPGLVGHFQASKRANWLKLQCSHNGRWGGERTRRAWQETLPSLSSQPLSHASRSGTPPWQAWDRQPSCGEEPGHPLKSTTPLISSVHTNPFPRHDSLPLTPRPLYQL